MKVLGINRVELVVKDPDKEADVLSALCGMTFQSDITEEHGVLSRTDFDSGIELAGPSREGSAMDPILANQGEGLLTIVFRVASVEDVIRMARANDIDIWVDLDKGEFMPGYKKYRQVSLAPGKFPAGVTFTFAEYEEDD